MERSFRSKRILSRYNPLPYDAPVRLPRRIPSVLIPSFIGESGQVLNLLMHEGAGGIVKDYSGFGNHGVLMPNYPADAPVWTDEGLAGWASRFDGVDDHMNCGTGPSLDIIGAITVMAWVNREAAGDAYFGIVDKGMFMALNEAWGLATSPVGGLMWRPPWIFLAGVVPATTWNFVGATVVDGVVNGSRLYVNGAVIWVFTGNIVSVPTQKVCVGAQSRLIAGQSFFRGTIALPCVYNVAKSPNWMRAYYDQTRPMFQ